jgi:WD40 repeat protein
LSGEREPLNAPSVHLGPGAQGVQIGEGNTQHNHHLQVSVGGSRLGWLGRRRSARRLPPAAQRPDSWVVDRPVEVDRVVAALRRGKSTVGLSTAVHGAGGFGKTTLARIICADDRVLRKFGGRIYWVTLGRDIRRAGLVEKINDLLWHIDPAGIHPSADVRESAKHLAAALEAGPPRLVVLDDVWFEEQLDAFPVAGHCARLVTTRIPRLVAGHTVSVRVDQMSPDQARAVLVAGLPEMPSTAVDVLLAETGRWPLLLRLINKILIDQARSHTDTTEIAVQLADHLHREGTLGVDRLTGTDLRQLNVNDPDHRAKAVAATIEASAGLLGEGERARLAELAIFAEDEVVPVSLVAMLWEASAGLDGMTAARLCARLDDLALLTLTASKDGGTIGLHDVVRDYLHNELGADRVTELHGVLLDAVSGFHLRSRRNDATSGGHVTQWWRLPESERYLWDHLIEHLRAAGRDAESVAADLRWVSARLEQSDSPAAPFADLGLIESARAVRLQSTLSLTAHLLTPTDPPHARRDVLLSRVAHDPDWAQHARSLAHEGSSPGLINHWTLPDLPDPALRHILTDSAGVAISVDSVAIAGDGSWLATISGGSISIWEAATGRLRTTMFDHGGTADSDATGFIAIAPDSTWLVARSGGSVSIWDPATGKRRTTLIESISATGTSAAGFVAIAPDSTWLATTDLDGPVSVWDAVTGRQRTTLIDHNRSGAASSVAIAPDGTWLATTDLDGSVTIWDTASGTRRTTLIDHRGAVTSFRSLAIAPDGRWLATISGDGVGSIWEIATGRLRTVLRDQSETATFLSSMAIAPDGSWLATGGNDGSVRVWDAATGRRRNVALSDHAGVMTTVKSVAIAPNGEWIATNNGDGSVRIWDLTVDRRRTVTGRIPPFGRTLGPVAAVAFIADGTRLITTGADRSVHVWSLGNGRRRPVTLTDRIGVPVTSVRSMAAAPDGTWLATISSDRSVRIWDLATGVERDTLHDQTHMVRSIAVAPSGRMLATGSDGLVRIWGVTDGQPHLTLTDEDGAGSIASVAFAPDSSWVAGGSSDGLVRIWDTVSGRQRPTLGDRPGSSPPVRSVAVAPDGTWLATTSSDGSARIWATTGARPITLTDHSGEIIAVSSLAIAPNGWWLATTSGDRAVRIWEPTTGCVIAMMRLERAGSACAWSPDGRTLVIGGAGGLYSFLFRGGARAESDRAFDRPATATCQIHLARIAETPPRVHEAAVVRVVRQRSKTVDPAPSRAQLGLLDDGAWSDLYPDQLAGWRLARTNAARLSLTFCLVSVILALFWGVADYASRQSTPEKPRTDIHTMLIQERWLQDHLL